MSGPNGCRACWEQDRDFARIERENVELRARLHDLEEREADEE